MNARNFVQTYCPLFPPHALCSRGGVRSVSSVTKYIKDGNIQENIILVIEEEGRK